MNEKVDIYKQAKNMEKANCDLTDIEFFVTLADYKKLEQQLQACKDKEDKYKNAWEDMSRWFSQRNSKYDTPKSLEIENFVSTFMQELEQKHNIKEE